jgi:hypothetical protein
VIGSLLAMAQEHADLDDYASKLRAQNEFPHKKIATLFDEIKHGDEAHQQWLKEKLEAHFKETA